MCGLTGIISGSSFDDRAETSYYNGGSLSMSNWNAAHEAPELSMFDTLLTMSSLRGIHSSGVFGLKSPQDKASIYKEIMNPISFMSTPIYNGFKDNFLGSGGAMIGHTRHATSGGMTLQAAHPHSFGNITLVHNGTLFSWKHLTPNYVVSDSAAITACLSGCGGDYATALGKFDGAFALIWHDSSEGKIYITRNKERPLWCAQYKNTFLISSELLFLKLAIERSTTLTKHMKIKYFSFEENMLYSIIPGTSKFTKEKYSPYIKPHTYIFHAPGKNIEKEVKNRFEVKKGDTVAFMPYDFSIYHTGQQRGSLYGILLDTNNKLIEDVACAVYGLNHVDYYLNCDFVEGTVQSIYECTNPSIKDFAPDAKYCMTLNENTVIAYDHTSVTGVGNDDNKISSTTTEVVENSISTDKQLTIVSDAETEITH